MATEELLRDLLHTEDSHRLVLEWLDRIESEHTVEQTGETDKDTPWKELAESRSTASRGGPSSDEDRSTAPRGGPSGVGNGSTALRGGPPNDENGSTAPRGGPHICKEELAATCGRPPRSQAKSTIMLIHKEASVHELEPLQSEDTQLVLTHISIQ